MPPTPPPSLGATWLLAAIALVGATPAVAESPPERGSISFRYLDYLDSQTDLERIRVRAPAVLIAAPLAGDWLFEGSHVSDVVSGASPAYHTVARSASDVHDRREAVTLGVTRYWPRGTLKLGTAYSGEADYVSRSVSVQGSVSSEDKNTTLTLGIGATRDTINPVNFAVVNESRATQDLLLGVTQVLTPVDIVQLNVSRVQGRGYFSDPYKLLDERPRSRDQNVMLLRWNHHFDAVDGTSRLSYRYYADSWDVRAHTITLEYAQALGSGWTLTPLLRVYSQSPARFYVNVNPALPTRVSIPPDYESGVTQISFDQRLSAFGARTWGIKVAKQFDANWQADIKFEQYQQRGGWYLGGDGSAGLATFDARMVQFGLTRQF